MPIKPPPIPEGIGARDYAVIQETVRQAREETLRDVFHVYGVDVRDPRQLEELRKDLRFAHSMRTQAEKGISAAVVVIVGGLLTALWIGISTKFGGGK